tara:strand:+ start:352 stop:1140 length:789 start_codon:yes stop_codon:yes gene_type:complete
MAELFLKNSSIGLIKSIIFDKDGTLLNSEKYLLDLAKTRITFSVNKLSTLTSNKLNILLLKKLLRSVYGVKNNYLSANSLMAIASREQNIISTATIFSIFKLNWFESLSITQQIFNEVDVFLSNQKDYSQYTNNLIKGSLDLLVSLKNEGVCIALMTNDTKAGSEDFISRHNLKGLFDFIWSADNQPSKPNPMAVIELCKKMNLKPSECALVSDADTDLRMARKADIPIVIGFTGGWTKPPTLTEKQFIIENLNELKIERNN